MMTESQTCFSVTSFVLLVTRPISSADLEYQSQSTALRSCCVTGGDEFGGQLTLRTTSIVQKKFWLIDRMARSTSPDVQRRRSWRTGRSSYHDA